MEAVREFKAAIPGMMAAAQENADDDKVTLVAARTQRLQGIVENYFILQARNSEATGEIGEETFSLADLRGPKVTLRLQLRFEAFGSTRIDLESVKMTYLRTPTSI